MTKASHTVIVDFGCGQHKQPGEGFAFRQAELCPRRTMMKKKRGRQKNKWEDSIKEWTGMDFVISTRAAENRDCCELICGAPTTFQGYGME